MGGGCMKNGGCVWERASGKNTVVVDGVLGTMKRDNAMFLSAHLLNSFIAQVFE